MSSAAAKAAVLGDAMNKSLVDGATEGVVSVDEVSLSLSNSLSISTSAAAFGSSSSSISGSSVGVVVAEQAGNGMTDAIVAAVVKALAIEGITGVAVVVVSDSLVLPYAAVHLAESHEVVLAASVERSESSAVMLQGSLMQAGITSGKHVLPAIFAASSLLEAKALLAGGLASSWASSTASLLQLKQGGGKGALTPVSYTPHSVVMSPVITPDVLSGDTLLASLRESLKEHGASGIFGLARKFKIADDDGSGSIDLSEFTKVISEHAFAWTPAQIKSVFDLFDKDRSGTISFNEFLHGVKGPMNERREQLVLMAFEVLDADKSGTIEVSDVEDKYDATKHPDVIAGKRSTQEVLREFLDTFDGSENKTGKISPAAFCEYYSHLSSSIDNDDYFELMIRNAWHISGGEGWCANSSCRRVLCTHADGHQTVEEIKNDMGIAADDKQAMLANLRAQGLTDVVSIDTKGSTAEASTAGAAGGEAEAPVVAKASLPAGKALGDPHSSADTVIHAHSLSLSHTHTH